MCVASSPAGPDVGGSPEGIPFWSAAQLPGEMDDLFVVNSGTTLLWFVCALTTVSVLLYLELLELPEADQLAHI